MGVNGDVRRYVDAMGADAVDPPSSDWSWADPGADPFTRHGASDAGDGFKNATNIEAAPTSAELIGGAWVRAIP